MLVSKVMSFRSAPLADRPTTVFGLRIRSKPDFVKQHEKHIPVLERFWHDQAFDPRPAEDRDALRLGSIRSCIPDVFSSIMRPRLWLLSSLADSIRSGGGTRFRRSAQRTHGALNCQFNWQRRAEVESMPEDKPELAQRTRKGRTAARWRGKGHRSRASLCSNALAPVQMRSMI